MATHANRNMFCDKTKSQFSHRITQCMKRLGLQAIPLFPPMVVTTVTDEMVETPLVCENCVLGVGGRTFQNDLNCLPLKEVDIILGIIWLSANLVLIGCEEN